MSQDRPRGDSGGEGTTARSQRHRDPDGRARSPDAEVCPTRTRLLEGFALLMGTSLPSDSGQVLTPSPAYSACPVPA